MLNRMNLLTYTWDVQHSYTFDISHFQKEKKKQSNKINGAAVKNGHVNGIVVRGQAERKKKK